MGIHREIMQTLIPDFESQVMAVDRVEQLLLRTTQALDRAKVPYAIIGGNAVAAWVGSVDEAAVRATKDVDVLLRRTDLAAARDVLAREGLDECDVHGVTMFLLRSDPNPKTGIQVVFAGEKVRPYEKHPVPDVSSAVRAKSGFLVIDLPALVSIKLQANRRIDQVHIEDMLANGLIDKRISASLPDDLQARLEEIDRTRRPSH